MKTLLTTAAILTAYLALVSGCGKEQATPTIPKPEVKLGLTCYCAGSGGQILVGDDYNPTDKRASYPFCSKVGRDAECEVYR